MSSSAIAAAALAGGNQFAAFVKSHPGLRMGQISVGQCSLWTRAARFVILPIMKKKVRATKLALSKLTLKKLTVAQIADAKGGSRLPVTSRRPDCGCA
jgi:hypothetical protein